MSEVKVLVVDDAPAIVESLVQALERLGVLREDIFTADDAATAMAAFKKHEPAIIFMDVNLGKDNGDRVAIDILEKAPATKVIVMTGLDVGIQRVRDVVSAGAFDVLEKPIRLARLKQILELAESEEKGLRRI